MIFNILFFTSIIILMITGTSCSKFEREEAKIILNDAEKMLEMQDEEVK